MKKTLFGGMKIKGTAGKGQDSKQKAPASQTNLGQTYLPKQQSTFSSTPDGSLPLPQTKPQLKQANTSILTALKEQEPKMHKKQSIKEESSKPLPSKQSDGPIEEKESSTRRQSVNVGKSTSSHRNQNDDVKNNQMQNGQSNVVGRKDNKRSLSERDYNGEDSEEREDVREDRSVVVGNYRVDQQKEQIEFKKSHKSKPVSTAPKSNPLLNQIKKISKTKQTKKQQDSKDTKQKSKLKVVGPQSKQQKPRRQKSTIMQQLWSSHTRILESMMRKKQAKQQIISLGGQVMAHKEELSVLVNKQNHYIATQEYELADKLQGKIEEISVKVEQAEMEMNFTQDALFKLQYEALTLLRTHLEEEKRTVRRIKLVELDIEDEITHYKRQQDEKIENSRLSSENQKKKFTRIVNDIRNQSQQLHTYEKTFYEDLNSRKLPLLTQLTDEESKKHELERDIKELEQKLKKKKIQLKSTLSALQVTRQKISEVDKAFEEERENLDDRKCRIQQLENQRTQQDKKLADMEDHLKTLEKHKTAQITKMTKQKQSYQKLSTNLEQFFASTDIQYYLTQKRRTIDQFISNSKSLKSFQQKHKQKKDKIKQLEFQKSNTLSQITKNEERIKQLKTLIPKLQNEQKQFSLAKNFKGAGMKKNQIKECNDQIVAIKKVIEESYASEAEIDAQVEEINSQQEKYIDEENQLRKQLAVSQHKLAVEKRKQVQKQLQWVRQLQKGNKIKNTYEKRLEEQLEGLQQEITYIASQYNLEPQEEEQQTHNEQKQEHSSQQPKVQSIESSSNPVQSVNNGTDQSESSYIPLTVNDNEELEEQAQIHSPSSKSHLESSGHNSSEQRSNQNQHQQPEIPQQTQQTHQPQDLNYQPLQLDHSKGQQDQDQNLQSDEEPQVQNQQPQIQNEEQNQDKHNQIHEAEDNSADGGYVPLQLD